ncbi:MAG TPA: hypothetical protein VIK13_17550 [Candidatus Limnocylindrales bacterium]|jgi:hypothetical protein
MELVVGGTTVIGLAVGIIGLGLTIWTRRTVVRLRADAKGTDISRGWVGGTATAAS